MYTPRKRRRSFLLVIFLMILGVVVGYSYGYLADIYKRHNPDNDKLPINNAGILTNSMEDITLEKQAISQSEVITEETIFVFERYYRLCQHSKINERHANFEEIGLSLDEVKQLHHEWLVKDFSPSRVLLIKELDGYCPDHYLIKEKDGYIAVFQTIENGEGVLLLCQTQMNVDFLENGIKDRVREGILVDTLEDVEYLIESWDS